MAGAVSDGNVKVTWVPTIADIQAPTVSEISAGTPIPRITKDGVNPPQNQNTVDGAGIDDTYDSENVGTWGGGPFELTIFRDDTDETDTYDLFVYGLTGFLVIGRFGSNDTSSDKVEVWPAESHEPVLMQTATNEKQRFQVSFAITSEPALRAVVAT